MGQKIVITMTVDSEYSDPDHAMGVTDEGFNLIFGGLQDVGDDIDIRKGA